MSAQYMCIEKDTFESVIELFIAVVVVLVVWGLLYYCCRNKPNSRQQHSETDSQAEYNSVYKIEDSDDEQEKKDGFTTIELT